MRQERSGKRKNVEGGCGTDGSVVVVVVGEGVEDIVGADVWADISSEMLFG